MLEFQSSKFEEFENDEALDLWIFFARYRLLTLSLFTVQGGRKTLKLSNEEHKNDQALIATSNASIKEGRSLRLADGLLVQIFIFRLINLILKFTLESPAGNNLHVESKIYILNQIEKLFDCLHYSLTSQCVLLNIQKLFVR